MLDVQSNGLTNNIGMSRKRTRSRSEENLFTNHIQPLNMSFNTEAPFHDEVRPKRIREECEYTRKITIEMAKLGLCNRSIRIYTDGVFDLFHQGHMRHLNEAKNIFKNVYLIVGVYSDTTIENVLKSLTVMEEHERYGSVQHCKYTDEVMKDAPWLLDDKFLFENKIDFVLHDVNSTVSIGNRSDLFNRLKRRGMLLKTEPSESIITTLDIVARIVRDYDIYIRRNLARGYSAKELNISYLNEKKILFQNKMHEIKDKSKQVLDSIGERTDDILNKWEEKSRDLIDNFLVLFKKDSLRKIWNGSKELIKAISPPSSRDPSPGRSNSQDDEFDDEETVPKKRRRLY